MAAIEVERKFALSPPVRAALLSLPGPRRVTTLRDRYYCERLALRDQWLRLRNGQWELKLPLSSSPTSTSSKLSSPISLDENVHELNETNQQHEQKQKPPVAVYKELTGSAVWSALPSDLPQLSLQETECFADLSTHRTEIQLECHGFDVAVTLDECTGSNGFKCSVGELEILVDHEEDVAPATETLNHLFDQLEVTGLEDREGKLIRFIRLHRPALFSKLCRLGLVPSP